MADPIDVSAEVMPLDPNAAPAAVDESLPAPALPDEVLQIPALQAVFAGAPPAVSFDMKKAEKTPEAALIGQNKNALMESGIGFYRSLGGDRGVLFNVLKVSGEDLKAADKAGKLLEIAPPAEKVSQDILSSGANHPALTAGAPSGAPAGAQSLQAPQTAQNPMPMPSGPPASQARQRLAAQLANLKPGAPTQGARPGAGRLLNSILKPVL